MNSSGKIYQHGCVHSPYSRFNSVVKAHVITVKKKVQLKLVKMYRPLSLNDVKLGVHCTSK